MGESGCGKSTVAKVLVGLERPTAGQILLDGEDVVGLSGRALKAVRRRVQIILQDPYTSLNPRMTIGDIVREPWEVHPEVAPKADRTRRAQELLERVGLNPDAVNRYPHQFSGGQRQRVGIARALALGPDLIVCDEPVSALDVSVQAQVVNLLEDLQAELGCAYLFVAHDLSVVRHISDRIAVMYLGRIVETGSDAEVYEAPTHPYTQALLSAVPHHDPSRRGTRKRVLLEGDLPSPSDPPSGCRFRTRCPLKPTLSDAEQRRCTAEDPELVDHGQGHPSACHFARGGLDRRGRHVGSPHVTLALQLVLIATSLLLVLLVLLHRGKGGGLSSLFGGGVSSSLSGSSVVEKNLDRLTVGCAIIWGTSIVALGLLAR